MEESKEEAIVVLLPPLLLPVLFADELKEVPLFKDNRLVTSSDD